MVDTRESNSSFFFFLRRKIEDWQQKNALDKAL